MPMWLKTLLLFVLVGSLLLTLFMGSYFVFVAKPGEDKFQREHGASRTDPTSKPQVAR